MFPLSLSVCFPVSCGCDFCVGVSGGSAQPERVDIAQCSDLPVTLVFLPAHDIAMFVGEGNVDIGITGLDVVKETSDESEIEVAMVSRAHPNSSTKCCFWK